MATCSIFKNFTNPIEKKSLLLIGKDIITGTYKSEVEKIRTLLSLGKKDEADKNKRQLFAFTPSAVFSQKRNIKNIEMYSGFVHLDFDKLTPEQFKNAFEAICKVPYTFFCFISPSGNGLKVFIEVNTAKEQHDIAYSQVQNYYEHATGFKADSSCKDVTRLCFMSYDPNAYKNIKNEKFIVEIPRNFQKQELQAESKDGIEVPFKIANSEDLKLDLLFNQQIEFTNQKASYTEGNRNNYIFLLASNCNRCGISRDDTEALCLRAFDLQPREIREAVKSAYSTHIEEFGKIAKVANSAILQSPLISKTSFDEDDEESQDFLKSTPTIPDEVFENLPDIIKRGSSVFEDNRKRDIFFTSAIAILSGCLPKVTGIYDHERVFPHLFTFIIAPSASGKGVLKNAKRLADKYHQKVLDQSRAEQVQYEMDMINFKNKTRNLKKGENQPEEPSKPVFKTVVIPANCSNSRMIEHLEMNSGEGIICETEADTMSGAKKQDWGDYSPILRCAFQHEKITITRKTNNEYIEINEPRLAVSLSGTPAQAPKIISSSEDGLFSRFLFYAFKNDVFWRDPSPIGKPVIYNDHFEALSNNVLELVEFLDKSPTTIHLTIEQWQILNNTFTKTLSDVVTFTSENASSTVYRLGLILFRVCMIFTALRKFENGDMDNNSICLDQDFDIALKIVQTYLSHSILMFNNLPKQGGILNYVGGDNKRKFFDALPLEFTRKEAIIISKSFQLSTRSVDDLLKNALGSILNKSKPGFYQKIKP